jgi:molybdopterin molybdotransferase
MGPGRPGPAPFRGPPPLRGPAEASRGRSPMTPSTGRLLPVEEALARLTAAVDEPLPGEEVALGSALGRTLSAPVLSALDLPPWNNSAMDGFAVHAADTVGASPSAPVTLRVIGEVRAGGSAEIAIPSGCAVRIATGAPVPAAADAVVPVESTLAVGLPDRPEQGPDPLARPRTLGFGAGEPLADSCSIVAAAAPGENVRHRGEDVRAGTAVLEVGAWIGPAQIALAAAVGRADVWVYGRPVVGVLSTGDELREPGRDLGSSGIPDANRPALLAASTAAGAEAADLGIARDRLDSVLAALEPAVDRLDAVIVSGGVSVGPYDVVRNAFEVLGDVELWRVAIQPGKPFAFGRSKPRPRDGRRVLLFGLPGNPVATLVTFELFVRPMLERLAGRRSLAALTDRAVTADSLRSSPGRRGYLRVLVDRGTDGAPLRDERGRLLVRSAGSQGSHVLSAMAIAEALAIVPEDVGRLDPGDEVEIRWLAR